MVEQLLKQLGFAEKEIKVYLTVLEQGKTTPANVALLTGINRSTVYSIAKDLLEKGVIAEDIAGTKGYLVALPPTDLKNLARKEERELQTKKVLIEQIATELQNFTKNTKYSVPKISFIYEEDLENFLYKQAPVWNQSILSKDGTWWGFQDPTFVQHYQKWVDWYWQSSAPENLILKLLSNDTQHEKKVAEKGYERRLIKFWNKGNNFTATTWICGDYLIMVTTNQHPHCLVQIHDATLAHNMREMFKNIWEYPQS
jgi:predicted transcriptional regulator